jgi:hypothetical protein
MPEGDTGLQWPASTGMPRFAGLKKAARAQAVPDEKIIIP